MSRFADVTTDTPHGPRPVPEGHIATEDAPPAKSLRSGLVIWGGVGLALTVGALAARAAAGALSGDDEDRPRPRQGPRNRHAPGYASLDDEARARMRARARSDFVDYDERADELRAAALRERHKRRRPPQQRRTKQADSAGFGANIGTAARNIVAVIGAATTALEGFRQVSAHSDEIMRDFGSAADRLQEFLRPRAEDKAQDRAENRAGDRAGDTKPAATTEAGDRRSHTL